MTMAKKKIQPIGKIPYVLSKDGRLITKKDKEGNLTLYRNDKCNDFYKTIGRDCEKERPKFLDKSYKEEIDEYLPERKGTKKYYFGVTNSNIKSLQSDSEHNCECLTIDKVPKNNVSIGNFLVTNDMFSGTKKQKVEKAKQYKMIPYIELERMKPSERLKNYGRGFLEFLVK